MKSSVLHSEVAFTDSIFLRMVILGLLYMF